MKKHMEQVRERKIEQMIIEELGNRIYFNDLTFYCSLLPARYVFTKDILVSQWMAAGFIELGEDKMEEVCSECFDILVGMDYIVQSGYDYIFHQMKFRVVSELTTFLQTQVMEPKFGKYSCSDATQVEHMSITLNDKHRVLEQYSRLQTLVIHDLCRVHRFPNDIFSNLESLKILNLSYTNIEWLPNSIEKLKELRFLDMSHTPIRSLPRAIWWFNHLQTLNLDDCRKLETLPDLITNKLKLTNFRHLIYDMHRSSKMPVGIGKLINLETMTAFLVAKGDGQCVSELKDLNRLRGSLSLMKLEYVGSKKIGLEACLYKKVGLKKIELQWGSFPNVTPSEEEILESLQPPNSIQELTIRGYCGGVLPSWISYPSYNQLVSIELCRCKFISSLPTLGELPSLENLSIFENQGVVEIDSSFLATNVAFPKLKKLTLNSLSKLKKWTGLAKGDFPSLQHLIIQYCPELLGVAHLSTLTTLSQLEIRYCPEFSCLPPSSLETLKITKSPKFEAQCRDKEWGDWSSIPILYIDETIVSAEALVSASSLF